MRTNILLLCSLLVFSMQQALANARVAIIIDDMGNKAQDIEAVKLPGKVTYSILPLMRLSSITAEIVHQNNKQVMLHMPMESLSGRALGPGGLLKSMDATTMHATLTQALDSVPHAVGLNNHMGSRLTMLIQPMRTTMNFLKKNDMFFVDSRTTPNSRAREWAQKYGVESLSRHVFLDHDVNRLKIERHFDRLVKMALRKSSAIAIGHPYPLTVQILREKIPTLAEHGIELVFASELLHEPQLQQESWIASED